METGSVGEESLKTDAAESGTVKSAVGDRPRTFKLTVSYDGTDFSGWQIQPGRPTIQGMLERALVKLAKHRVHVVGSGRTDSGVHALAQVASFKIPVWRSPAGSLVRALNVNLPETITALECVDAPDDFHAIRDSLGKRYRYQMQLGGVRDAFQHRYRWHLRKPLDIPAMQAAAALIVGQQDFASFQAAAGVRLTTVRHVRDCVVNLSNPGSTDAYQLLSIEVEADGFLYNMVRNIVGTLVEVGRGKYPPEWVTDVIAVRDRDQAGPTAPALGLFLARVDYEPFRSE